MSNYFFYNFNKDTQGQQNSQQQSSRQSQQHRSPQQQQGSSEDRGQIEDFQQRYLKERDERYDSMVEGFMRPTEKQDQAKSGLFLPFMAKGQESRETRANSQEAPPQEWQQYQQPQQGMSFDSERNANEDQYRMMQLMQQQQHYQQQPQQYGQPPQNFPPMGSYGHPQMSEPSVQFPYPPNEDIQKAQSIQQQQLAHLQGMPQTPAPSPQTPNNSQKTSASPQQDARALEEQFISSSKENASESSEEQTRPRKPSNASQIENQLFYLYPRRHHMEKTYNTLSHVHVRYGSFMSTPDVYFIAKNHLRGLSVENPYVDDYYYMLHRTKLTKSAPAELTKWVKKHIHERQSPPPTQPPPKFDTRLFGRISGITPKAPRVVVDDVEPISGLPSTSKLNTPTVQINCQIEEAFDQLLIIDDHVMCFQKYSRPKYDSSELTDLSTKVYQFIESKLMELLSMSKGIKVVCKALRILPEEYSLKILLLFDSKWEELEKKFNLFQINSPIINSICKSIRKFSSLKNLTTVLTTFFKTNDMLIERLESEAFIQILAMTLQRVDELRRRIPKGKLEQWKKNTYTKLIFNPIKELNFKVIVEKHNDEMAWFVLASILLHSSMQQKQVLLDHVREYTQSKDNQSTAIQSFLAVAKKLHRK